MGVWLTAVRFSEGFLEADLSDGHSVKIALELYPRLENATHLERSRWRLTGNGEGVYWPDLDEQISVGNILAGSPSGESQRSFQDWLKKHRPW
jgi:Protein of unknown function (DUF2442)